MPTHTIYDPKLLHKEIVSSHERCRQYGIKPSSIQNPDQVMLTQAEFTQRLKLNSKFFEIATAQIEEIYQFVAGAGFAVTIADGEGYLLKVVGDEEILQQLAIGNCLPGYRWTEKDVGTSAVSLVLKRRIPVQINENEHYCKRGHGYTCSASPVFSEKDKLAGVIALSGRANQVHPHTLGMVITASKAIENTMRIRKTSDNLVIKNNYMNTLINSIDSGVIAVDKTGCITQINNQGKKILKWGRDFLGKPLHTQFGAKIDIDQVYQSRRGFADREFFIKQANKNIQLMVTANPIFNLKNQIQGIIIIFNEINRIRRLVNHIAGSQARFRFKDITGISPTIEKAKHLAMVAASSTSTVLITGKTGTGKELFAQAIHNKSKRQKHPFLTINCSAIPKELIESELFGYAEGAFTGARKGGRPGKFELANGGTVLLDEIGDMPLNMQTKLLRVLQTRRIYRIGEHKPIEVDIRIIAATHVNLKNAVSHGNFREDLFYRLNVFPIKIPPLKKRIEDILLLANNILNRISNAMGKAYLSFSADSENSLLKHSWHGNVRELENVVERAVNVVEGKIIEPMHMGLLNARQHQPVSILNQQLLLKKVEMETISETLEAVRYNISSASKILGISRATLYTKIDKYHLSISKQTV